MAYGIIGFDVFLGAEDEMPPLNAFSPTPARAETRSLADGSPVCITGLSGQKHLPAAQTTGALCL